MKIFATIVLGLVCLLGLGGASAQSWQPLANKPGLPNIGTSILLRDGRVLAHGENSSNWQILTPDATGSYLNGTWSAAVSMPAGYAPYSFSSAVLSDGRVIVKGGEYINGNQVWTNLGAIYDPVADQWTAVSPPLGWATIGDAASAVLSNGMYMQANCCTKQVALLDPKTLSWSNTGSVLTTNNNEAGWVLLPNGQVLMVNGEPACGSNMSSEVYDPASGKWFCGPQLPVQLWGDDHEVGVTMLMYNNQILQFGGFVPGTAILDLGTNQWSPGPTPGRYGQDDGPAVLLPNGKVLAILRPNYLIGGCQFMEYDPGSQSLSNAPNPPECPKNNGVPGRLLMLPTGQVLFTHYSGDVEIYNPAPGIVASAAPTIHPSTAILRRGSVNNLLYGSQLNGLSQASMYGDDAQYATNYPIVRFRNVSTNVIWWARTHDDSSRSIAANALGFTNFDLNPQMPAGAYDLTVITNGIPSNTIRVIVSN